MSAWKVEPKSGDERLKAAEKFAEVMHDLIGGDLRDEYGKIFTCTEAEVVAGLFSACGYEGTAATILASHIKMDCNEYPMPHEPGNYRGE